MFGRVLLWVGLTVVASTATAGCSSNDQGVGDPTAERSAARPRAAAASDLEGRTYQLIAATDRKFGLGSKPLLSFGRGKLEVFGGCNSFYGRYVLDDGRISQHGPSSTQANCFRRGARPGSTSGGDDLHAQDEWLTDLLDAGASATVTNDAERLMLRSTGQVLTFMRKPT